MPFRPMTASELVAMQHRRYQRLKSCWVARTPYQAALMLILFIGVPFLIAMIIIYVVYSLTGASELCADLCTALLNKTDLRTDKLFVPIYLGLTPRVQWGLAKREEELEMKTASIFGPVDGLIVDEDAFTIDNPRTVPPPSLHVHEGAKHNEFAPAPPRPPAQQNGTGAATSQPSNNTASGSNHTRSFRSYKITSPLILSRYPAIAALTENLHADDDSEKKYHCMAVLLSNKYALTSSNCMQDMQQGFELNMRINSDYWSKGGFLAQITKMKGLLLEKSEINNPPETVLVLFEFDEFHSRIKHELDDFFRVPSSDQVFKEGLTFTWYSDLSLPLKKRKKYAELREVKVEALETRPKGLIVGIVRGLECLNDLGGPLLSTNGSFLLGVHLYTKCMEGYVEYYFADLMVYFK